MRRGWWVVGALAGCPAGGDAGSETTSGSSSSSSSASSGAGTSSGTGVQEATTVVAPTTSGGGATSGTSVAETTTSTGEAGTTSTGENATSSGETSTGGAPLLRIEPAGAVALVTSGWSFPAQFVAVLDDGMDTPVAATWTLDDASIGRVTRYGGTFAARGTAGGVVQIAAEADGQVATAEVEVVIVDDAPACPPRPPLTDGEPAPGMFVKVVAPEYEGTGVYHGVYLPPDWTPGRKYPVIVESPCNAYQAFTGKVEDTRLAYHASGCRHYVWIVVPYIQAGANLDYGWGETAANVAYWQINVRRALEKYGGDPGAVFVAGFSRGAIGASYVGLQDLAIADMWLGFFMHSHADVVSNLTPDMGAGSSTRMGRVGGRSSLLSWGAAGDGGAVNSAKGVELLTSFGSPVTTLAVPGVGHTDQWIVDDAASRAAVQSWLFATAAARPGTGAVYGRVTDGVGEGVAGVRVEAGAAHWDVTDAAGHYGLRGLTLGMRTVTCTAPGCGGAQMVDVGVDDVEDVDFVAP